MGPNFFLDRPLALLLGLPLGAAAAWLTLRARAPARRDGAGRIGPWIGPRIGRRVGAAVLVALAAAGPSVRLPAALGPPGPPTEPVVLVDRSASFRPRAAAARGFVDALPEPWRRARRLPFAEGVGEAAGDLGTDIAGALAAAGRAGAGGSPPAGVLVVTDGIQTAPGDPVRAAAALAAAGVPVHVYCPEPSAEDPLLSVESLDAPARVRPGAGFAVEARIRWNGARLPGDEAGRRPVRAARVRVGGETLGEVSVALPSGGGSAAIRFVVPGAVAASAAGDAVRGPFPGVVEVTVELDEGLAGDPIPEDDRISATVLVEAGSGEVLLVSGRRDAAREAAFASALTSLGVPVRTLSPADLPGRVAGYAGVGVLILDDVPFAALGSPRAEALGAAVERLGVGLLALGGPSSFGPGGYAGTALDRALPLESAPESRSGERLALVIAVDRSGSMAEPARPGGGRRKLAAAADALVPLPRSLPGDRLAVLAFARAPEPLLALSPLPPDEDLRRALLGLRAEGETDIFPALLDALRVAAEAPDVERRHVLLVSDGRSDATPDRAAALARFRAARARHPGVTVSVVAVGLDADADLLREVAAMGGGRYEAVEAGSEALAAAFARELDPRRLDLFVEGPFGVEVGEPLAGLEGRLPHPLPEARAMDRTAPRAGARVHLGVPAVGPLLATGGHGLGRTGALAARAGPAGFDLPPGAFAAVVKALERPPGDPGASLEVAARGRRGLSIQADVREPETGAPRTGLALDARVLGVGAGTAGVEDRERGGWRVRLLPVAPGLYRGELAPVPEGPVAVVLIERDAAVGPGRLLATALHAPGRAAELASGAPDRARLRAIAAAGGGAVVEPGRPPAELRLSDRAGPPRHRALAPVLGLLAVLLALADLAAEVRRRPGGPSAN